MRRGLTLGLLFLVAILTGGCGSGHVPVTGNVTFNGAPVSGAQVTFISEDGKTSYSGVTNDTGSFELVSGTSKGALPGAYKVTVVKSPKGASSENTKAGEGDYMKDMMASLDESKKGQGSMAGKGGPTGGMKMGVRQPGSGGGSSAPPASGGMAMGVSKIKSELPVIYAMGTTTSLKVTVPHDGPLVLDLKGEEPKAPAKK